MWPGVSGWEVFKALVASWFEKSPPKTQAPLKIERCPTCGQLWPHH
jgi:hypothetical protein